MGTQGKLSYLRKRQFRRPYCVLIATKALQRSFHCVLPRSTEPSSWRFIALSRRFHCDCAAVLLLALLFHGVLAALAPVYLNVWLPPTIGRTQNILRLLALLRRCVFVKLWGQRHQHQRICWASKGHFTNCNPTRWKEICAAHFTVFLLMSSYFKFTYFCCIG